MNIRADNGVFGDGSHETTRMMLEAIQQTDLMGKTVLDIGTGTGILAISAAMQGAEVTATDIDLAAILTARENFKANGVDVKSRLNILDEDMEGFDLVLANIEPHLVQDLMARRYGTMIVSFPHGMFRPKGWEIISERVGGEWDVFTIRR